MTILLRNTVANGWQQVTSIHSHRPTLHLCPLRESLSHYQNLQFMFYFKLSSCNNYNLDSLFFQTHIPGTDHTPWFSVHFPKHGCAFCFKEKVCFKTQQLHNHQRQSSGVFKLQEGNMCCKGSCAAAQVLARQGDTTLEKS